MVLRGGGLEIKLGFGFLIESPLKLAPNDKTLLSYKRGAIYLLNSSHTSWNHYFVISRGELQFESTMQQLSTFHMDLDPLTHVQLRILTLAN